MGGGSGSDRTAGALGDAVGGAEGCSGRRTVSARERSLALKEGFDRCCAVECAEPCCLGRDLPFLRRFVTTATPRCSIGTTRSTRLILPHVLLQESGGVYTAPVPIQRSVLFV